MAFEVLPAIDVAGGRLVSASGGQIRRVEAFGGSPFEAARAFADAGASWLHVVDVDRAAGRRPDRELLRRIADVGPKVQASGGIESEAAARDALAAGASRVVLGSAALADRGGFRGLLAALRERAVVGIEADGAAIRPRTAGAGELPLRETLGWLSHAGAARYLYTGVSRVARLGGPDVESVRATATALGRPILVAGGIRGVEDVLALRALGEDLVEGVVIGRALFEGVDLADVLDAVG